MSIAAPADAALEAFDNGAAAWCDYLSTPLGRLRHDVSLHYLTEHLGGLGRESRVLDAGGGTGSYAVPLSERGCYVCLLDFSTEMLALARDRILSHDAGLLKLVYFRQGNVEEIAELFPAEYFDLILCHTLLEYLADPLGVARKLVGALRPGGLISFLLTNNEAEAIRWVLARQDLQQARQALERSASSADLFGLSRHTLSLELVAETLSPLGMMQVADYGVRVVADYLPSEKVANPPLYRQLLDLEKAMGRLHPYKLVARYRQLLMRKREEE
jgi:S-adenosylmethionine-dependent methyltransferase